MSKDTSKRVLIAYLLMILGFLGAHKFYLARHKTAIFYIFLFIGAPIIGGLVSNNLGALLWLLLIITLILDLFTLPKQCKGKFLMSNLIAKKPNPTKEVKQVTQEVKKCKSKEVNYSPEVKTNIQGNESSQSTVNLYIPDINTCKSKPNDSLIPESKQILDEIEKNRLFSKSLTEQTKEKLIDDGIINVNPINKKSDKDIALRYYQTVCKNGKNVRRDENQTVWVGEPKVIEFTYSDADGNDTERKVGVYRFSMSHFKDFYLTGYCFKRKEERTFKAIRIMSDIKYQGKDIPLDEWVRDNYDPNKSLRKTNERKPNESLELKQIKELAKLVANEIFVELEQQAQQEQPAPIPAKKQVKTKEAITLLKDIEAGQVIQPKIFNDIESLDFNKKHVVLTGNFKSGEKRSLILLRLLDLGAINYEDVSSNVDVLIVGEKGSAAWRGQYGKKIETAVELQKKGHSILIISETSFYKLTGKPPQPS